MKQQTTIIYLSEEPESFDNLLDFCNEKEISYNTYSKKQFPFIYNGFEVHKVPFTPCKLIYVNNKSFIMNADNKILFQS